MILGWWVCWFGLASDLVGLCGYVVLGLLSCCLVSSLVDVGLSSGYAGLV